MVNCDLLKVAEQRVKLLSTKQVRTNISLEREVKRTGVLRVLRIHSMLLINLPVQNERNRGK